MADPGPHPDADAQDGGEIGFTFDGQTMAAAPGQSIAGALLRNGIRVLRSTRGAGRPRGVFCGIGNCFDCLVDVGDERAIRACLRPVAEGDELRTSASVGPAMEFPDASASIGSHASAPGAGRSVGRKVESEEAELLVVGGGPAGMAASLEAADLGCQVTLVDAGRTLGGQIYRQANRPGGQVPRQASGLGATARPPVSRQHGGVVPPAMMAGLPERFRRIGDHARIRRLQSATVWAADRYPDGSFAVHVCTPDGDRVVRAPAVVVATGAAELSLPFPGWDLPGVMTAGAAQALVKGDGVLPGRRVVVAGSGPFLLPVAATLVDAGASVVAVIEAGRAWDHRGLPLALAQHPAKLRETAGYLGVLVRHRVPLRTGRAVLAADGRGRVERVQVAHLDRHWQPRQGSHEELRVDAVCVSFGFVPALDIVRALGCADETRPAHPYGAGVIDGHQASTVRGVFLAGETTGVGGAEVAELEGLIAGRSAATFLGHADANASAVPAVRRRLRRARRFASQLEATYRLPTDWLSWLTPDTVVCRCEEVAWGAVGAALDRGAADLRAVKGMTRCGMGYCQGRICGPPLQHAVATRSGRSPADVGDFHTRHIVTPVTFGRLASIGDDGLPPADGEQ